MELHEALEALTDIQGFLELFSEDDPEFAQRADRYNEAVMLLQSLFEQNPGYVVAGDEDDELGR